MSADFLDHLGFAPAPIKQRVKPARDRRRRAWWWVSGLLAVVLTVSAVALIVTGLQPPHAAPLPAHDFSSAASNVPNPVAGPAPQLASGKPGGPASGPYWHSGTNPNTAPGQSAANNGPGGQSSNGAAGSNSGGNDSGSNASGDGSPVVPDQSGPRTQVPAGPLSDNRLLIPAVGINAQVLSTSVVNGELTIPEDVQQVTDWTGSAALSAHTGTVLVAGHIDNINQGMGVMWPLHLVQSGDAVYLTKDGVVTRWKIVALQSIPKPDLPSTLFVGSSGARMLKLVTCGGGIANGSYFDNIVATAVEF